MKKVFTLIVLLIMVLTVLAGCQLSRDPNVLYDDPLSDEQKEAISDAILDKYNFEFSWDRVKPDLGTINDCIVVIYRGVAIDFELSKKVIADCVFEGEGPFFLFAYRNGEVCYLGEAYENDWLTKEHIGLIHAKYEEVEQNWHLYWQEWVDAQKEAYQNGRDPDVLYKEPLTEEQKESMRSGIWNDYDIMLRWGYVDPYYGIINNCRVVIIHPFGKPKDEAWQQEIAGYSFEWDNPIELFVYRYEPFTNTEVCTLQEAYEKGLLTQEQIGKIFERHNEYRANFPKMLEDWENSRKELQGS